jgi:hypothetical protein
MGIERRAALLRTDLDDGAPAPLEAALEKARQNTLKRKAIEMVE